MDSLLHEMHDLLGEDASKTLVSSFSSRVAQTVKNLSKKRSVYVTRKEQVNVSASTHKPEYDNFDYSYYYQLDIPSGRTFDLRQGLEQGQDKVVQLTSTLAVISGNKHSGYLNIYAHPSAVL